MMNAKEFNDNLVGISMPLKEFSRVSGIKLSAINKYSKEGVPDSEVNNVIDMMFAAKRKIFFGKQMDIEDY